MNWGEEEVEGGSRRKGQINRCGGAKLTGRERNYYAARTPKNALDPLFNPSQSPSSPSSPSSVCGRLVRSAEVVLSSPYLFTTIPNDAVFPRYTTRSFAPCRSSGEETGGEEGPFRFKDRVWVIRPEREFTN